MNYFNYLQLKKSTNYLFPVILLSITLNSCNTPPSSPINDRKQKNYHEPKKIIFILNALWPGMEEFYNLNALLLTEFGKEDLNIDVISLNTEHRATSEQSITQQAI